MDKASFDVPSQQTDLWAQSVPVDDYLLDGVEDIVEASNCSHRGTEGPVSTKEGQIPLGF